MTYNKIARCRNGRLGIVTHFDPLKLIYIGYGLYDYDKWQSKNPHFLTAKELTKLIIDEIERNEWLEQRYNRDKYEC